MPVAAEFQKPTFDARIQYYDLLKSILTEGKKCAIIGELNGWYRCLHITYNMVCAYIEPEDRKKLRVALYDVRQKILNLQHQHSQSSNARMQHEMSVDKQLLELDESLHNAAKRMMLPLENINTGEFDIDRFMRESDLAQ